MTKNNLYHGTWKLRATGVLVLALALSTFPAAFSRAVKAQTPAKATAQTPAKTTASPATESKGGPKEAIKVHGHWTIDVRNPDGKLVTHREFENALSFQGGVILSRILGRTLAPGLWGIGLDSLELISPWGPGNDGSIYEPNDPIPLATNGSVSKNLSLCVGSEIDSTPCPDGRPRPPGGTLLLTGNISAKSNGTIKLVLTLFGNSQFTGHQLEPLDVNGSCPPNTQCLVNVVAGQIIQVTVVISFS